MTASIEIVFIVKFFQKYILLDQHKKSRVNFEWSVRLKGMNFSAIMFVVHFHTCILLDICYNFWLVNCLLYTVCHLLASKSVKDLLQIAGSRDVKRCLNFQTLVLSFKYDLRTFGIRIPD